MSWRNIYKHRVLIENFKFTIWTNKKEVEKINVDEKFLVTKSEWARNSTVTYLIASKHSNRNTITK